MGRSEVFDPEKLGDPQNEVGKLQMDKESPEYDEYMANRSYADILERAFAVVERYNVQVDMLSQTEEDITEQLAEIQEELVEEIVDDPAIGEAIKQFARLSGPMKGLIQAKMEGRAFTQAEVMAFVQLTRKARPRPNPRSTFFATYLKTIMTGMETEQKIGLLKAIPYQQRLETIGMMKSMKMMSDEEVESFLIDEVDGPVKTDVRLRIEQAERATLASVEAMADKANIPKRYKLRKRERKRSRIEEKYRVNNLLWAGGYFAGLMTFIINSAGAVRYAARGEFDEAFHHLANHPYIYVASGAMALTKRMADPDRKNQSVKDRLFPGHRKKIRTLVDEGVGKQAVRTMMRREVHGHVSERLETLTAEQIEGLKSEGVQIEDAFPSLKSILAKKGKSLPRTADKWQ